MNDIQVIQSKIYEIRGQRVMLDRDLAVLYQVETRTMNQAVKRNITRFPDDFMFRLTETEWGVISSQFVMTSRAKRPKSPLYSLPLPIKLLELEKNINNLREEMDEILHDQNDINESTRAQLDAISTALAELQTKEPPQLPRKKIGFVQEEEK